MTYTAEDTAAADITLLDRVARRDIDAAASLYDRHNRLLFGLIVRILKDRGESEEVLQEVYLTVWNRAASYDARLGSPAGWLVGIARNRAIDRLRMREVRNRPIDAPAPPPIESPEAGVLQREQQRAVVRALDALPADQRSLIESAYFQGLTHTQLAARYELPLGTVKTRIRTGMMALRQQLQENVVR